MVDVTALSSVLAGPNSPALALPTDISAISNDALQALNDIATQGGLSPDELNTLSGAVAQVDSGVQTPALRQNLLGQVSGLGLFLRNTDSTGFPRWPVMTALRAYGMNLSGQSAVQPEQLVAAQVQQTLTALSNQSRSSDLGQALAAATAAVVVGPAVAQQQHNTTPQPQQRASAANTSTATTPAAPARAAPTTAVDTFA